MKKAVLFILVILIFTANIPVAVADPTLHTETHELSQIVTFKGVFSGSTEFFDISKHWDVQAARVNIYYTITQLAVEEYSVLTLSINGTPFYSFRLTYVSEEMQTLSAAIPLHLLQPGQNALAFQGYIRVTIDDEPCIDDVSVSNWMNIFEETNIAMDFAEIAPTNEISQYPYPFVRATAQTNVCVSDMLDNHELEAASFILADLGRETERIKLGRISEFSGGSDVIYVGLFENTPSEIMNMQPSGEPIPEANAVIVMGDSPYGGGGKLLAVMAPSSELLNHAARLLANSEISIQLNMSYYVVDAALDALTKKPVIDDTFTIADLNIPNGILLKGAFRQSANVFKVFPKNRTVSEYAKITLNIRYSENLDFNRSLVTIFINGTPIGSKKLEKQYANGDVVELYIPNDLKGHRISEITVAFDLELPDLFCSPRQEEMPWAFVAPDSYFFFPTKDNPELMFDYYPYPFVKDMELDDVLLILPDNMDSGTLTAMGGLLAMLGVECSTNRGEIKVIRAREFNENDANYNTITIGAPADNALLTRLNDDLFFKYNNNFTRFVSNEKLALVENYAKTLATAQLLQSPFHSSRGMLVITAPSAALLDKIAVYFRENVNLWKLSKDFAMVDEKDEFSTFRFKTPPPSKPLYGEGSVSTQTVLFLVIGAGVLLLILVIFIIYFIKNRRGNR